MSDLWSDRIDLTDLEAVIDEHGGLHVAYNLHEDLLCVKEKAKADKLALLDNVYLEFCDTGSGSVEQFIRLLKQRIEAG